MVTTIAITYEMTTSWEIYTADTFVKRFAGYMLRRRPHHEAILFKPCSSIHTHLMRFDIDVLFLNEENEVIKKLEGLKPGKMILPVKGAVAVMETAAGGFKFIEVGNRIS